MLFGKDWKETTVTRSCWAGFQRTQYFKALCEPESLDTYNKMTSLLRRTKSQIFSLIAETDEEYSKPLFETSLPYIVELFFSIPANWFGLSLILLVGPLWTGLLLGPNFSEELNVKLLVAATLATVPLLVAWWSFLFMGNMKLVKKVFIGIEVMTFFPLLSMAICYYLIENPALFSATMYPLWLWMSSVTIVLFVKRCALRSRPCVKSKFSKFIEHKNFQVLPQALGRFSGNESFPSGDAAGGMAFALSIALGGRPDVGITIAVLVCAGRVYFLAHHVLDTVAGVLITLSVHLISGSMGFSSDRMSLGPTLVMHMCFLVAFICFAYVNQKSHTTDR